MKTIAIIGSTGSIGTISLKIIKKYLKHFKIEYLYAQKNYKKIKVQYKIFKPKYISLEKEENLKKLNLSKKKILTINNFLSRKKKIDYIISATSGYSCIDINFKLLRIAKNLLIANKETIICGGKIFLKQAKKYNCKILPIDSEHYCISHFLKNFNQKKKITKFYLTASGGPFLKKKPNNNISLQKVLKHPNWSMGKKNSINSANLVNKILELFEAYYLFEIPKKNLNIKIENTSKIHSIISLDDGLDYFICHNTSMEIPIENSLINDHLILHKKSNFIESKKINFQLLEPNRKSFPIVKVGFKVLNLGSRAMIIFTIINDRLVEMFMNKQKRFNDIVYSINQIFKNFQIVKYCRQDIRTTKDIKKTIQFAENISL